MNTRTVFHSGGSKPNCAAPLFNQRDSSLLHADSGWTSDRWEDVIRAYFGEHDEVGTGADARGPALLIIDRQPGVWRVRQILDDPAGDHDWGFDVEVDLEASDEEGSAVLRLIDAGRKD